MVCSRLEFQVHAMTIDLTPSKSTNECLVRVGIHIVSMLEVGLKKINPFV